MTQIHPDVNLKLHCNISDKSFSWALFLVRFFTGTALIYLAVGCLLYWREFLVNTASLGLPAAVPVSFGLTGVELLVGLFLLLGWFTRFWAGAGLIVSLACMVIFFAGNYNPIFVVMCLLLCACFSILCWLGSGAISLDYKRSQRQFLQFFRG